MSLESYLMVVNVQVAICRGPEYLFIRRGDNVAHLPGILDIPGGKAEFNGRLPAALEETARREIKEEVGLDLGQELRYVTSSGFTVNEVKVINVVFLAPDPGGDPVITQPDEVGTIEWHHLANLMDRDRLQPWTQDYLQRAEEIRVSAGW